MKKGTTSEEKKQVSREKADGLADLCGQFLLPVMQKLDQALDLRLVNTLHALVLVILMHRHRNQGLVLSELGGQLMGADRAPAGSKRIGNLLRSQRWQAAVIEEELWAQGDRRVNQLAAADQEALVIWDESENEKPESLHSEGLCPVRSAKAARLKRIKPGFFNPPGGRPIFVPGYHWLQIIVAGMKSPPCLVHIAWWTSRGERATDKRSVERPLLERMARLWGCLVVHVFDQGFCGSPWVSLLLEQRLRFVLRWRPKYQLVGAKGTLKAWEHFRGKRAWDHQEIWDARRRCWRKVGVIACPVQLPDHPARVWLVATRPGPGQKPWYLLTSDPVTSAEDAWRVVFAYARRWQIEMVLRFEKSELAFESPRLRTWDARFKFLLIVTLAYAFLLLLLAPFFAPLLRWLLDSWCHRTGKWSQETPTPLYRLRLALSHLWQAFRPPYLPLLNSG